MRIKDLPAISAREWITSLAPDFAYNGPITHTRAQRNKFLMFLCQNELQDKIIEFRKRFDIPIEGFIDNSLAIKWAEKLYSVSKIKKVYQNSLQHLTEEFNVNSRWENILQYHIIFNKNNFDHLLPAPFDASVFTDKEGRRHLSLEIYPDSTLEEIQYFWPEINEMKIALENFSESPDNKKTIFILNKKQGLLEKKISKKPERNREPLNLELYLEMYRLRNKKMKYADIASKLSKNGRIIGYNDISRGLNKFKRLAKNTKLY